jgi:acyl-CoA dehydrogenase
MNFTMSEKQAYWRDRVIAFMNEHVYPAEAVYDAQMEAFGANRWQVVPVLEELKAKAKKAGLWNLFLPHDSLPADSPYKGAGLTNLEYALCAEQMGRVGFGSEVFNCSAPDTGNMEVLARYANDEQKAKWLQPLLAGEIRSAFLMTEPAVASSDATNIETSIKRDGDHYVINGRKWWSSGVGDPRCKIAIVMGKTDPDAPRHSQQSQILVPLDAPGIEVVRMLPVFGFDDAPHGHAEVLLKNVRVPAANLLLGEGRGFEIAQGRLGPGRIHHCMRTIGVGRTGAGEDGQAAAVARGLRQAHRRADHLGRAHRRCAHRHRDDAPAVPEGRRHDGQGGQQGGAAGDRDDQGAGADHGAAHHR